MGTDSPNISGIQQEKQDLRAKIGARGVSITPSGKAAELLRRQNCYRKARQIFVAPDPVLHQVRINCLMDGKELIMPGAGLKDGFYLLKPYSIPFADLPFAVTMKGLGRFGQRLSQEKVEHLSLSLLVTNALAVDRLGNRLGDGSGFFDLTWAILKSLGGGDLAASVAAVVNDEQILKKTVPASDWDVPVQIIVTDTEVYRVETSSVHQGKIFWEHIAEKKIRKMTPLWWISNKGKKPAKAG